MVRSLIILLLLLLTVTAKAQVIKPDFDPETSLTIHQLWDVIISPTGNTNSYYYLTWQLTDKSGKILLEAKSKTFSLVDGNYFFLENQIKNSPYQYNFIFKEWERKCEKSGSAIPPGIYTIKYTLFESTPGCNWAGKIVAEIVFPLSIQHFNQVELMFPVTGDTLQDQFPILKWLPLSPDNGYSDNPVFYKLKLAEILPGQKPEQAIQYNASIYSAETKDTWLSYPIYAPKLEKKKTYVWQISAVTSSSTLAISEIWIFTIDFAKTEPDNLRVTPVFNTLSSEPNPDNWLKLDGDFLYFSIETEKNLDKKIEYIVIDCLSGNKEILSGKKNPMTIAYGKNFYSIPVSKFKTNGRYTLQVKVDNELLYLNFIKN